MEGTYQIESARTGTALELAVQRLPVGGLRGRGGRGGRGDGRGDTVPGEVIPAQGAAQVSASWPSGPVDLRMSAYVVQAQQKWTITPANAGGYPGSPYFKITIAGDGFIQRWLILEPVPTKGQLTDSAVQTAIKTDFFPNQLTVMPRPREKVTVGGSELTWHAVDTTGYNVNLYHFAYALGKSTSNVLFWAVSVVNGPRDMPDVRLAIGSNAASVWWVGGREVIGIYNDRQTVIDDGVSRRLTLQKGSNVVRAAVINGGGATDFCARFLDGEYRPVKDLTVTLAEREVIWT